MRQGRRIFGFLAVLLLIALGFCSSFVARPVWFFRAYEGAKIRLAGAESEFVTIHGYRVHYYVLGRKDGRVVVLVHGLGGRAEDWENLAPSLAKNGYRVYLPDLPGYGQSEKPVDFSYSVADQAAVVVGFLDAMGLKEVDLGGWSMGGWIVQIVAANHPERIRKLILFDSAGLYLKPEWNTNLFAPTNAEELNQLYALLMPNPPKVPGFVARDILRISQKNAWIIRRALTSMLTGRDATDRLLPNLKMPVLILWGSVDEITPLSEGEAMQKLIPHSELEVITGCGHLAPDQCAAKMAPGVVRFLGQ